MYTIGDTDNIFRCFDEGLPLMNLHERALLTCPSDYLDGSGPDGEVGYYDTYTGLAGNLPQPGSTMPPLQFMVLLMGIEHA